MDDTLSEAPVEGEPADDTIALDEILDGGDILEEEAGSGDEGVIEDIIIDETVIDDSGYTSDDPAWTDETLDGGELVEDGEEGSGDLLDDGGTGEEIPADGGTIDESLIDESLIGDGGSSDDEALEGGELVEGGGYSGEDEFVWADDAVMAEVIDIEIFIWQPMFPVDFEFEFVEFVDAGDPPAEGDVIDEGADVPIDICGGLFEYPCFPADIIV